MRGIAGSAPPLERETQRVAHVRTELEALHEHVGHFAAGREIVSRPLARVLLDELHDLVALLRRAAGGGEGNHVADHLRGIARIVHERLGTDRDLVAKERGHFVRMARASHVAQQRHPVGGIADLAVEARRIAHPGGEQARPQLRLERLAERVVLGQRQGRDEFAEAKGTAQNGEFSRCMDRPPGRTIHITQARPALLRWPP